MTNKNIVIHEIWLTVFTAVSTEVGPVQWTKDTLLKCKISTHSAELVLF